MRSQSGRIEAMSFGACCACRGTENVHTIMMLDARAPIPGQGWGCHQCGLPLDGAVAVACDACVAEGKEILDVCKGYPHEGGRMPMAELSADGFWHDLSKHPEYVPGITAPALPDAGDAAGGCAHGG